MFLSFPKNNSLSYRGNNISIFRFCDDWLARDIEFMDEMRTRYDITV